MTVRFTIRCPKLAQHKVNGIGPDYMKNRVQEEQANGLSKKDASIKVLKEIEDQTVVNERYNKRGLELGDILISKLTGVDMTWCNDGHVIISCNNTAAEVETVLVEEGLEIKPDRTDIKHRVQEISPGVTAENIDEVFKPKTVGELKKVQTVSVINKTKI